MDGLGVELVGDAREVALGEAAAPVVRPVQRGDGAVLHQQQELDDPRALGRGAVAAGVERLIGRAPERIGIALTHREREDRGQERAHIAAGRVIHRTRGELALEASHGRADVAVHVDGEAGDLDRARRRDGIPGVERDLLRSPQPAPGIVEATLPVRGTSEQHLAFRARGARRVAQPRPQGPLHGVPVGQLVEPARRVEPGGDAHGTARRIGDDHGEGRPFQRIGHPCRGGIGCRRPRPPGAAHRRRGAAPPLRARRPAGRPVDGAYAAPDPRDPRGSPHPAGRGAARHRRRPGRRIPPRSPRRAPTPGGPRPAGGRRRRGRG